ncbi:hypothetical protein [Aquabacterium olei]|uniref:hypothetical protein n=1 Tax=Aquabacterium olei TaxID=1296669 RepID=UPI00131EDDB2|nr:hypothetical protein [Aquabacterium olei]
MNDGTMPTEDEIQQEFGHSIEIKNPHRFLIQEDGTTHFGLLDKDGKNHYFMASPEVMGRIALEILNLTAAAQRIKEGDPEKRVTLPFSTNAVFTLIPKGNGTNGAIEFQFLTDNNTCLSTLIGPELSAQMASSLLHVLSTMPSPPKIHEMHGLHSKLKGKEHSGQNTEIFFGQSYDVRILKILGILVIRANLLEGALAHLLASLMEISRERAEAIFYSTQNMKARSDLIRAAAATAGLSDKIRNQAIEHIDKIDKISRRRNQLVHGEWSFFKDKFSVKERKPLANTKTQDAIESYKSIEEICAGFHDETVMLNLLCNQITEYRATQT